jgi:hypothetical protein
MRPARVWRSIVSVGTVIALTGGSTSTAGAATPITDCPSEAGLRAAVAAGGDYVFTCAGTVAVGNSEIVVTRDVVIDGGPGVTLDAATGDLRTQRLFRVASGRLTLRNTTISGAAVVGFPAAASGQPGTGGTPGTSGALFDFGQSGTDGQPGTPGTAAPTDQLAPNEGACLYVAAGAELVLDHDRVNNCTIVGRSAGNGGDGGDGGNGGNGSQGRPAEFGGAPAGPGGNGGGGGAGADGGDAAAGADAKGGALSNHGTTTITDTSFASDAAYGGDGGNGGAGGDAGSGGTAGDGDSGGIGGTPSGTAGRGGRGGAGGAGKGGAIYNAGRITITRAQFSDAAVRGGRGGSGGQGGHGGAGGSGGRGLGVGRTGGPGGTGGAGASGGLARGGAIYYARHPPDSDLPTASTYARSTLAGGNVFTSNGGGGGAGGSGGTTYIPIPGGGSPTPEHPGAVQESPGPNGAGGASGVKGVESDPDVSTENDDEETIPPVARYRWQGISRSCLGDDVCDAADGGVDLSFDATTSAAASGHRIAAYRWDFGDGTTATDAQPTHAFAVRQPYVVTLTVTDESGVSASATTTVRECAGDSTNGGTVTARSARTNLRAASLRDAGSGAPFACYYLAAQSRNDANQVISAGTPDPVDTTDRLEPVVVGKEIVLNGTWGPGKVPVVQFRDAACAPTATCADSEAVPAFAEPNAPFGWRASYTPKRWPKHWDIADRAKACRGYLLAGLPVGDGKVVRRRITVRARPAGYVVYSTPRPSSGWKTGDVYCTGENPMDDVGFDQTIVTRPFDPVPTADEKALGTLPPPAGLVRLYAASPAASVDLSHSAIFLAPEQTLCVGGYTGRGAQLKSVVVTNRETGVTGQLRASEIGGLCPKASSPDNAAIHDYGVRLLRQQVFDQAPGCLVALGILTGHAGPSNMSLGGRAARQDYTCTQRVDRTGGLIEGAAQLPRGQVLVVNGGLRLRIPVAGSWRLVADGSLVFDQGVQLGTDDRFDVPALVAAGSIVLERGPPPRGITAAERDELLVLADAADQQSRTETWAGVLTVVLANATPLRGVKIAKTVIDAIGSLLTLKGGYNLKTGDAIRAAAARPIDDPDAAQRAASTRRAPAGGPRASASGGTATAALRATAAPAKALSVVPRPKSVKLPAVRAGRGLSRAGAAALTALRRTRARGIAYATAFSAALDRGDQAARTGAGRQERAQILAAARYARTLAATLLLDVTQRHRLAKLLKPRLGKVRFTAASVARGRRTVKARGLPPGVRALLTRAGVPADVVAAERAVLASPPPKAVRGSLLGVLTSAAVDKHDRRTAALLKTLATHLVASVPQQP